LTSATAVLFALVPVAIAMRTVELNYAAISTWVDEHTRGLGSSAATSLENGLTIDAQARANQVIGNFLASSSAFLDNTSRRLRRSHGASSHALKKWDDKRKKLHDAHFAYQFLFQLRHFAQHRALPISGLVIHGTPSPDGEHAEFRTVVSMSRDRLLEEGFDWKHASRELQRQPPEFDLIAFLPTYLGCLQRLFLLAVEPSAEELKACEAHLATLISEHQGLRAVMQAQGITNAIAAIFTGPQPTPDVHPPKLTLLPTEQLERLVKMLARLRNECAIA
jgi:hypothetical protein